MPEDPTTFEVLPAAGFKGDRLIIEVREQDVVEETADEVERIARALARRLGLAFSEPDAEHRVLFGFEPTPGPSFVWPSQLDETWNDAKPRLFIVWILAAGLASIFVAAAFARQA